MSKINRLLTILIVVFPLFVEAQSGGKTFQGAKGIFKVALPETWMPEKKGFLVQFRIVDPTMKTTEISLTTDKLVSGLTLDELMSGQVKELKDDGSGKLNGSSFVTINNQRWGVVDYTSNTKGMRYLLYHTIYEKTRYSLLYVSSVDQFDRTQPLAVAVANSFTFYKDGIALNGNTQEPKLSTPAETPSVAKNAGGEIKGAAGETAPNNEGLKTNSVRKDSKAGIIAPDAKAMEVDKMHNFFGAFAVVEKGSTSALINDKGEFFIPFNTFEFKAETRFYPSYFGTLGLYQNKVKPVKLIHFKDVKTDRNGLLTTSGKLLYAPKGRNYLGGSDEEGYFPYVNGLSELAGYYYYDGTKEIPLTGKFRKEFTKWKSVTSGSYGYSNGLLPALNPVYNDDGSSMNVNGNVVDITDPNEQRKLRNKRVGFVNRAGQFVIQPDYYEVAEFSEGIAFVSKLNEFDEPVWGAIDVTGKLVIPYKFRRQPGRFSHSRSLVEAIDMPTVSHAFIDKKGEIVFTIPKNSGDTLSIGSATSYTPSPEEFLFMEGYYPVRILLKNSERNNGLQTYLMDTTGHYTPITKLMIAGLPDAGTITLESVIRNGQFIFSVQKNHERVLGMADVKGNILLPPVFSLLHFFEEESKLQYAEVTNWEKDKRTITRGYIDRTGTFRIILQEKRAGF